MSCFQDPDHLEADSAAAARLDTLPDAIDKVLALYLERLYPVNGIWDTIADVVCEVELLLGVRVRRHIYALVMDHELIHRIDVVIDEHLFTADDRVLADFDGIQPADPDFSQQAIWEVQAEISHIVESLLTLHINPPMCAGRFRLHVQHIH